MNVRLDIGKAILLLPLVISLWSCRLREQKEEVKDLKLNLDSIVKVERLSLLDRDTIETNFYFKYLYYKGIDSLNYAINRCFFGVELERYPPQELVEAYYRQYVSQRSFSSKEDVDTLNPRLSDYHLFLNEEYRFGDILSISCQELEAKRGRDKQFPSVSLSSFSVSNNNKISESDVFVDDYTESLAHVIQIKLMQNNKVHKAEDLIDEGFFAPREIGPNGNFMITPLGIRYAYLPQEIAPYNWGTIYVDLTWDDIAHLIRPGSIVERYI